MQLWMSCFFPPAAFLLIRLNLLFFVSPPRFQKDGGSPRLLGSWGGCQTPLSICPLCMPPLPLLHWSSPPGPVAALLHLLLGAQFQKRERRERVRERKGTGKEIGDKRAMRQDIRQRKRRRRRSSSLYPWTMWWWWAMEQGRQQWAGAPTSPPLDKLEVTGSIAIMRLATHLEEAKETMPKKFCVSTRT